MSSVFERICARLDEHKIEYKKFHHEPTPTSQDAARVRGVDLHSGAKALVLRGSKTGQHYLFVVPADLRLNGKKIKLAIGENTSFAADPTTVTGCVPGSVPPFGSIVGLTTYCDLRLAENERINFNAGSLTDSIQMGYTDYLKIEQPRLVDISES